MKSDYLLILINIILGLYLLSDVLVNRNLSSGTIIFQNVLPLLLFPVFNFFIYQFTHSDKRKPLQLYLYFLPSLVLLGLSLIDHYVYDNYSSQGLLKAHFNHPGFFYQLIFKTSQVVFIVGLFILIRNLRSFKVEIRNRFSEIEKINVQWLRQFTWIYLGTSIITLLLFTGQNLQWLPLKVNSVYAIVFGILTVAIFYMNYQGIHHLTLKEIKRPEFESGSKDLSAGRNGEMPLLKPEVRENSASKENLEKVDLEFEQELLTRIETDSLYLNPELRLDDLADILGKNKHEVSRIINAREGRTFYDVINTYRVQHLQNLMNKPKNWEYTILALALESGFNSKASLNRIFKKVSGLTPSAYLQECKARISDS